MIDRRTFLGGAAASGVAAAGLSGCASRGNDDPDVIRYWGFGAADTEYDEAAIAAFKQTEAGRDITIAVDQVPSNGASDNSQIITAVRGGTAPDLWLMDRFNAVQNASIGLLEPLDDMIEEFEGVSAQEYAQQWIQFAVDEVTYDGRLYGLPMSTDARGIEYNEDVLRRFDIDLDLFDPEQHVLTWDELREVSRQITTLDSRGNYEYLGFCPWRDEAWSYTWGFGMGAELYDNATSSIILDSPAWLAVYELFADWAEEFPYPTVDAFFATYQPPNAPPTQSAMFSERLAMLTTGPFAIRGNERYAPDIPFKFTYLPVNQEGDDIYSWSGGSAFVVPSGSTMTKNLWEFMKFYAGTPGQNLTMPKLGDLPTNLQTIVDGNYNEKAELFRTMLPYSTSRPPVPVGSAAWSTLSRTRGSVTIGSMSPQEAIEVNQAMVEPKMALFEGYQMPDTYGQISVIPES